jgi:hypothetical protein
VAIIWSLEEAGLYIARRVTGIKMKAEGRWGVEIVQGSSFLLPSQQGCQLPNHRHPGKRLLEIRRAALVRRDHFVSSFLRWFTTTHARFLVILFGLLCLSSAVATCWVLKLCWGSLSFQEVPELRRRAEAHDIIDFRLLRLQLRLERETRWIWTRTIGSQSRCAAMEDAVMRHGAPELAARNR